jgi:hypothetical protein
MLPATRGYPERTSESAVSRRRSRSGTVCTPTTCQKSSSSSSSASVKPGGKEIGSQPMAYRVESSAAGRRGKGWPGRGLPNRSADQCRPPCPVNTPCARGGRLSRRPWDFLVVTCCRSPARPWWPGGTVSRGHQRMAGLNAPTSLVLFRERDLLTSAPINPFVDAKEVNNGA